MSGRNLERDVAGAKLYVRLVDPHTGAAGFVAISPACKPDSALRFARGRPPTAARGVPLHTPTAASRGTEDHVKTILRSTRIEALGGARQPD